MTEAELKRMLQDYNRIKTKLKCYQERIDDIAELVSTVQGLKAVAYTGMPGNPSNISDPTYQSVERVLCKYQEEAEDLKERIQKLQEQTDRVDMMLRGLDYHEGKVIFLRHVEGWRWSQVVPMLPFSSRHCRRLERKALNEIRENKTLHELRHGI